MLYFLLYDQLHTYIKAFNVFRYLTFLFADRFVGKDLARGLANLKAIAEAREGSLVA